MKNIKNRINRTTIIKESAKEAGVDLETMRTCYCAVEKKIKDYISSVDENNTPLDIKLSEGISILSEYIPTKDKISNLTGKKITVEAHIKPKFNITRHFINSINS